MQLNRGNMESALSNEMQDQLIIGPSFTDGYAWALEIFSSLGQIGRPFNVVDVLYYKESGDGDEKYDTTFPNTEKPVNRNKLVFRVQRDA